MSPQQPRRPASSRGTTPRPRKIAGRRDPVEHPVVPDRTASPVEDVEAPPDAAEVTEAPLESTEVAEAPKEPVLPEEPATPGEPEAPKVSMFAGAGLTRNLLIGLVVLIVLVLAQGAWFTVHALRKDDVAKVAAGEIAVPKGRPVVLNQTDVDQAVDEAAKDAVVLVKRNYKTYDDDVAKAVDLLTNKFSIEYKNTAADVKSKFTADRIDVEAKVVAQGVVRANATQVQALLFLDQYVTKGKGKNRRVTYTPYKVLVTMIHTDHGWLVDDLDTK